MCLCWNKFKQQSFQIFYYMPWCLLNWLGQFMFCTSEFLLKKHSEHRCFQVFSLPYGIFFNGWYPGQYGGPVMHNSTKSPQHNEITTTQRIGLISLCCGLFPLCCGLFLLCFANFVVLRLVCVVACFRCVATCFCCVLLILLCCGLFVLWLISVVLRLVSVVFC